MSDVASLNPSSLLGFPSCWAGQGRHKPGLSQLLVFPGGRVEELLRVLEHPSQGLDRAGELSRGTSQAYTNVSVHVGDVVSQTIDFM